MAIALDKGYLLATDIADYLVNKGATFRNAHEIVGKLVSWAIEQNKTFNDIDLSDYLKFSPLFENDVYSITIDHSVSARNNPGGTAPEQVIESIKEARETLARHKNKKAKSADKYSILSAD
jgi:argininosuccinate lyase